VSIFVFFPAAELGALRNMEAAIIAAHPRKAMATAYRAPNFLIFLVMVFLSFSLSPVGPAGSLTSPDGAGEGGKSASPSKPATFALAKSFRGRFEAAP